MAEEPPPGVKSRRSCNLVNILLMFREGAISSLELLVADRSSPAPSPDLDRTVSAAFFSFRKLWTCEGSLLVVCSLFRPHETEVVRGSLADIACEDGGATAPLSYNPEHELARPATPVPYPDPASSSFPEFWPSPVFWTALMSYPDPDSVIAHVLI